MDQLRMKKACFEKSETLSKYEFIATEKSYPEALYKMVYRIAKQKKSHTILESLINHVLLKSSNWFAV